MKLPLFLIALVVTWACILTRIVESSSTLRHGSPISKPNSGVSKKKTSNNRDATRRRDSSIPNAINSDNRIGVPPVRLMSPGTIHAIANNEEDLTRPERKIRSTPNNDNKHHNDESHLEHDNESSSNHRYDHDWDESNCDLLQIPCQIRNAALIDQTYSDDILYNHYHDGNDDDNHDDYDDGYEDSTNNNHESDTAGSLRAFIDTGAQVTVMSLSSARKSNLLHLIDRRYSGQATGVGSVRVVGRIPAGALSITLGCDDDSKGSVDVSPPIYVLQLVSGSSTKDVDLLIGLDVLNECKASVCLLKGHLTLRQNHGHISIPFINRSTTRRYHQDRHQDAHHQDLPNLQEQPQVQPVSTKHHHPFAFSSDRDMQVEADLDMLESETGSHNEDHSSSNSSDDMYDYIHHQDQEQLHYQQQEKDLFDCYDEDDDHEDATMAKQPSSIRGGSMLSQPIDNNHHHHRQQSRGQLQDEDEDFDDYAATADEFELDLSGV